MLAEAAVGVETQLAAALDLEADSGLMEMFMGRQPFVREIRGSVSLAITVRS